MSWERQESLCAAAGSGSGLPSKADLEGHLLNWAQWMMRGGLPSRAPGRASGGIRPYRVHNEETVEIEMDHIDSQNARACDATISDLAPIYRSVLHVQYLDARWQGYDGHNFDQCLSEARALVRRGLLLRAVYVAD